MAKRRVSTHASARDATEGECRRHGKESVSTHASARDATGRVRTAYETLGFQLTRPRGTRQEGECRRHGKESVSTHASARDATDGVADVEIILDVSTHASARDATTLRSQRKRATWFQLTRPRGTRQEELERLMKRWGFNSRVREGRDKKESADDMAKKAFQLTRPRGTRLTAWQMLR